jgi:hypothetical protein
VTSTKTELLIFPDPQARHRSHGSALMPEARRSRRSSRTLHIPVGALDVVSTSIELLESERTTGILPISLIGMPGSGKSTVGKEVARRLGLAFADCDQGD